MGTATSAPTLLLETVLGAVVGLAIVGIWRALARTLPLAEALEAELSELIGPLTIDQAWALALLSGVAEELFFRGAMLAAWGLLPSSLIFAVLHTGRSRASRLWTGLALCIGLLFGGLTLWRGGLIAAIVAHTTVNGLQLARLGTATQATDSPPSS